MKVDMQLDQDKFRQAWQGFAGENWKHEINVRDFIQQNYTPYEGDEQFLADATEATTTLWNKVMEGIRIENATHAPVDFDTNIAPQSPPTGQVISSRGWKRLLACKPTSPLKERCTRLAV